MGVPIFHFHDSNIKRTAILGKTHVQQSFFVQKKTDGTLCSARDSGLPTPFPYSKQNRNCDASSNFIDCNPQKARRRKFRQQDTVHPCTARKAKGYSLLTRTADCSFPSRNKAFKKRGSPLPPQHDPVRTEGFLHWVQYSRVTLLLHKNCHILTVRMS